MLIGRAGTMVEGVLRPGTCDGGGRGGRELLLRMVGVLRCWLGEVGWFSMIQDFVILIL